MLPVYKFTINISFGLIFTSMALPEEYTKQIQALTSENEFLQLQLEDLNNAVRSKDEEIHLLGDSMESAASLQSRIDMNLAEIEQLSFKLAEAEQRTQGAETLNEELEKELLKEIRAKQRQETELKGLSSVKTELEIITGEMNETASMYQTIRLLKSELAETHSKAALLAAENEELKTALREMKELMAELRKKKFD